MIVAIIPDRFRKNHELADTLEGQTATRSALMADVRRPTRGLQLKEDTYATLRVLLGNGNSLPLVNAGTREGVVGDDGKARSHDYSNFLIQSVNEERAEKQQVVETFGEAFIFFFGERPRVITVQGVLLNTFDFNWEAEWWHNYEHYLRGTKCVEHDARVYLTYDDTMVSGYIMSTTSGKQAAERNHVPFAFQLFVTDYTNISRVGDPSPDQRKIDPDVSQIRGDLRPTLMLPRRYTSDVAIGPNGLPISTTGTMQSISLVEGLLRSGIGTVNEVWQRAQSVANAAMLPVKYLDQFLGNPVRVPRGFEGAVVFDETDVQFDIATQLDAMQVVRYTAKFGDNSDEFVGRSSHYASADLEVGRAMDAIFSKESSFQSALEMTKTAQEQWTAVGITPPQGDMDRLLTRVTQNPLGMKLVGAARNWLAGPASVATAALNKELAAAAPIAAGVNQALGSAALADNLLGAVSPGSSQALDRAVAPAAGQASSALAAFSNRLNAADAIDVNSFKALSNQAASAVIGGG